MLVNVAPQDGAPTEQFTELRLVELLTCADHLLSHEQAAAVHLYMIPAVQQKAEISNRATKGRQSAAVQ